MQMQAASPNTQTRNSSDWGSRKEGGLHFVRRVKARWKKLLTGSRGVELLELFLCLTSVEISQSVSKTYILCLGSVRWETDSKISKGFAPIHTVTKA